jgi:hypothetical protein
MYSIGWGMATKDRLLYSALHGTAWRHAAEALRSFWYWYPYPRSPLGAFGAAHGMAEV